jgi:hypothetical protein
MMRDGKLKILILIIIFIVLGISSSGVYGIPTDNEKNEIVNQTIAPQLYLFPIIPYPATLIGPGIMSSSPEDSSETKDTAPITIKIHRPSARD